MAPRKRDSTAVKRAAKHAGDGDHAEKPSKKKKSSSTSKWIVLLGLLVALAAWLYTNPAMTDYILQTLRPSVKSLATVSDHVETLFSPVQCSEDYEKEISKFPECVPRKCGRVVKDSVVSTEEAAALLKIGKKGLALGGGSGGASILDLHSGALSYAEKFIDIYSVMKESDEQIFTEDDFALYSQVKDKIHDAICDQFGIPKAKLFLTHPTFFSQMTDRPAKTVHDEYWHNHIDKLQYGTFDYTSLLYLTSYGTDFEGGRFFFVDKDANSTVEPKLGRVSFFTSGSENVHHVEKVSRGTRYAITVSFTCDPQHAIRDPRLR